MKKGWIAGLAVIAVIAGGGYFVAELYADRVADRRIEKMLTKLPKGTAVKYRTAGYSIWNGEIRLRDVKVDSQVAGEARIKGVTVADFDKFHRVPHYVKVKVRGFEMTREKANPATRRWMDKLGYKSITVDVHYAYRYRPDLRELIIEKARITGPQVGTLEVSGRLSNVRSLDVRGLGDLIAIGMQSVVRGIRVSYTDGSLTDRKLAAPVGSDGMTLDEKGNLYLARNVVHVYSPQGENIATIEVPEAPANVCFGAADRQTLFITARKGLYAIRMNVRGQ